ncbi:hypothetical protein L9F63_024167 [Diploptera punctata]|uniref:Janus kinase and microtubule-interacting protein C-terminal domain-containing protein n=1 Tax=Diploptera punctata TaxID=6984 RepID=A0AAD7ZHM4_DIPPU|nr:hypothetical protein L9F63_024167 [Diploptera punctata]
MEESAISNSKNSTISTKRSTADLTAVPLLHAMLDQLRSELATVRVALDSERSAVRALKRDRAAEIKGVREEEARKRRDALSDLKSRLERDHEDALQRQKDAITKTLNAELLRSMKTKDMEVRHELSEVHAREESLKQQVREALRANRDSRSQQQANANIGEINKLQQEVSTLRAQNKHLEERYQMMVEADRQKAVDLRSQHEEHELELNSIKKNSKQEIHRLLEELKSKDRLISQLEKQLNVQTGQAEKQQLEYLENRKINTMDKKTASPKSKILRQTGENTESLSEEEEFPDTFYPYILKDSFELMCDQQPLQSRRKREAAERIILEHELATARTKIRELKRMLIEQRGGSVAMAERISSLQAEVHELREQNELLEFRILELEECHESASIKSHSPDTRTDTESDSGILSLPNSDDVGTDTDLGIYDISVENPLCKIPEHSPSKLLSRIIAKVLPFTDSNVNTSNDNGEDCNHSKKKLSNTDHLQESGIFEEDDFNTQSTQTDDILVLDEDANEFKSLLENGEVGDLSTEIKKLTQFRELVEERANYCESKKLIRVDEGKGDLPQGSCASHIKELQYYKERVQVLEDKVVLYESSDDTKVHLLAKRLQTELNLSAQVKELTDRVNRLSNLNRQLEEEKCEFEEAENDTRLKCQKLEMKIVALNEKRSDLQAQLQQERRNMNRLRTSLSRAREKGRRPRDS